MKKGFTLVELLIVMAVIAILIGIAIPSFRGMQQEAWRTQSEGDTRVLKIACESLYKNTGAYPVDTDPVVWQSQITGAIPTIVEVALNDPFQAGSVEYTYDRSANGYYYVIYSIGPSGTDAMTVADSGTLSGTCEIYATNGHL